MEAWKEIESCFGQQICSSIAKNKFSQKLLHDAALFISNAKAQSSPEDQDLASANHWIDQFFKRTALEPLAERLNKQLTEIGKCLLEFEIDPQDFACQSILLQRVSELMLQHHKWIAQTEAKKREIESFTSQTLQQMDSVFAKAEKEFREIKRSIQQMKSEAIGYRHDSTALQLMMANEMLHSESIETFDLQELNVLFAEQNELDREMQEVERQLLQYKGIPADLNLAKVELAKVSAELEDLCSEKEDLIYRLSFGQ